MVSVAKKRIENVFKETIRSVSIGQQPNITRAMLKQGYSLTSARTQKVVRTKTWEILKAKYLDDEKALITLSELSDGQNEDKDNRLKASTEILKLNERYPKQQNVIVGLFNR